MGSLCFSSRVVGNTVTVHIICFWNKMKFTHEIQGVDKRFGRKYVNISARTILNKKPWELFICLVSVSILKLDK